jgi:hypothetical protein
MLLMFSALFFAAATRAQSQTAQPPPTESPTAQPSMIPPQGRDDVTMQQLVDFGDFLNRHPEIADQLRRDPSLVDNQDFVNKHPELQEFLQQHPEIRAELSRNPDGFMRQEDRLDRREEDPNRAQLADMDQFLNRHPEIAEQLRKDPSLVNNREFVENHPALQQFLADHPEIRTEFKDHPDAFMRDAERFDHHDDRGLDPNRAQLADMDQFLNRHPEIAEQLRKDPSLVNNREFVENHPAFQAFLTDHPEIRTEFKDHPDAFMRDAERFDHHDDSTIARNRNGGGSELSSFNQFLAGHGNIAGELSKNPSLANNHEYLETHPELQAYLAANPQVHEQLNQNPQVFVQSAQQMSTHSTTTVTGDSKPK